MLPREDCKPQSVGNLVYRHLTGHDKNFGKIESLEAQVRELRSLVCSLVDRLVEDRTMSLEAVGGMLGYPTKIDAGKATNFKSEPVLEYLGTGFPSDYK